MSLKGNHADDLDVICHLYHSEFDKEHIRVQLLMLGDYFDVVTAFSLPAAVYTVGTNIYIGRTNHTLLATGLLCPMMVWN